MPRFPKEAGQNLCFLARERARERERKRTRNKNFKFFGYVHVYEHEHVHVVISKVRLWGRFCRASLRYKQIADLSPIYLTHIRTRMSIPSIVLGISVPLTVGSPNDSDVRSVGEDVWNAATVAWELLGLQGELLVEDNRAQSIRIDETIRQLHKAGAIAIVGLPTSDEVISASSALSDTGLVALSPMATSPKLDRFPQIFRARPSDAHSAKLLVKYMSSQGITKIGVLSEDTAYSWDCATSVMEHAARRGIEALSCKITTHSHLADPTETRQALDAFSQSKLDALFINTQDEEGFFRFVQLSREALGSIQIFGSAMPGSRKFRSMAGKAATGIIYVEPVASGLERTPEAARLLGRFRERFGEPKTGEYAVLYTFASLCAVAQATRQEGPLSQTLSTMTFDDPVNGAFRFEDREIKYLESWAGAENRIRIVQIGVDATLDLGFGD